MFSKGDSRIFLFGQGPERKAQLILKILFFGGLVTLSALFTDVRYTIVSSIVVYGLFLASLSLAPDPQHSWLKKSHANGISNETTRAAIRLSQFLALLSGFGFIVDTWNVAIDFSLSLRICVRAIALLYVFWLVACGEGSPSKHLDALICISTTAFWLIAASLSSSAEGNIFLWYPAVHSLTVDVGIHTVLLFHDNSM